MTNREFLESMSNGEVMEFVYQDILENKYISCDKIPIAIYVTEILKAYRTYTGKQLSGELTDKQLAKQLAEPCCEFCIEDLRDKTDDDKKSIIDEATNLFMEWLGAEYDSVSNIMNWLKKYLGTKVDAGQYWNWVWLVYDWPMLRQYEPDWEYEERKEDESLARQFPGY